MPLWRVSSFAFADVKTKLEASVRTACTIAKQMQNLKYIWYVYMVALNVMVLLPLTKENKVLTD